MKSNAAMFVFITGLLVTFGAVGGIEQSITDTDMLTSMVVAIVGLLVMYCGVLALKGAAYYD
jgi:hypothetical protein